MWQSRRSGFRIAECDPPSSMSITITAMVRSRSSMGATMFCLFPFMPIRPSPFPISSALRMSAAQWLSDRGMRPAILDVDYHHGNGTQSIFYGRNDVLFVSIHADPSFAYPHFLGFADEGGQGAGEGFNLDLPLPRLTQWPAY